MLTKLCGNNFMGGTFTVELGPLNYVYGRNDAGKSRLDELIKLLLLGYSPNPNVNKTAQAIYDAYASGVRMEIDGALSDGSVIHRTWEMKGKSVKSSGHVPEKFDDKTPLVLLDPLDYFGRSARGRVEMVFAVAKIDDDKTVNEIIAKLGEIGGRGNYTTQEWIDRALESIEDSRKTAAADVRRFTGTLQGLTSLQLADKPAARSVDDIDEEIDREQKAGAEKTGARKTLKDEQEASEKTELERDDLAHRIEQAGSPSPKVFDIDALRSRETDLAAQVKSEREAIENHGRWVKEDGERLAEVDKLSQEIRNVETAVSRIPLLEEQLEKMKPVPAQICTKCKQPVGKPTPEPPEAMRIRNEIAGIRGDKQWLPQKESRLVELRKIKPEPAPGNEKQLQAIETELRTVRAEIDEYVATADVQSWRTQLAQLQKPKDNSAEIKKLEAEITAHDERVGVLREERRAAEGDRADRRRLAEAQTELTKATTAETSYKAAKAFLLEKKAELIEQVFGPLLKTAALFMKGIFPQPVEYRDGELGMFSGSTWVTATFGGAKRALLYAALKCALGAQSPLRIIQMDELSTIDPINLKKFLSNVKEAHLAGVFDQYIGMTCRLDGPVPGFTMIEATGNGYVTH